MTTQEIETPKQTGKAPTPKGRVAGKAIETPQVHASMAVTTEREVQQLLNADAKASKERLAKQPRCDFLIPLSPGEQPGAYDTVQINGYKLTIQKGVMVNIPRQVAEILAEKYAIQTSAGSDMLLNRPFTPTPDKPVPLAQALG